MALPQTLLTKVAVGEANLAKLLFAAYKKRRYFSGGLKNAAKTECWTYNWTATALLAELKEFENDPSAFLYEFNWGIQNTRGPPFRGKSNPDRIVAHIWYNLQHVLHNTINPMGF